MNVLITGFEPFEGEALNPSWEAARALDGWRCEGAVVHARRIACVFGASLRELDAHIDLLQPSLVVCVGQAGGRSEITPERVAINLDDGRICDNAGCQPIDEPVIAGAPAAYFSTLPIKAIARSMREAGVPSSVSNTAGTFVCNHLFFGLMHRLATRPPQAGARGGFIHIPYVTEQTALRPGVPALELGVLVEGLRIAIRTALTTRQDLRETAGRLH